MAHSDETRAAVMAALLAGQSINQVAKEFSLAKDTVSRWRQDAPEIIGQSRTEKGERLSELVYSLLAATLASATKQTEHFHDPEWIRKYSPSEAAVLFGVTVDKAARLIDLIGQAEERAIAIGAAPTGEG